MHPSSNNCHRKQNPSKKNKGPGNLTDTENKTHQTTKKQRSRQFNWHRKQNPSNNQKKKKKGPGNLTDTENKTHQKKKKKGPSNAWKVPGQTDK
jgi:hypothetical protein